MATISSIVGRLRSLVDVSAEQFYSQPDVSVSASEDHDQITELGERTLESFQTVVSTLLNQTLPLSQSILYWNEVLESPTSLAIYGAQTMPWWIATGIASINSIPAAKQFLFQSLSPSTVLSPLYPFRNEVKAHRNEIIKMRNDAALRLGTLVRAGISIPGTKSLPNEDKESQEHAADHASVLASRENSAKLQSSIALCIGQLHSAVRSDYFSLNKSSYASSDFTESVRPSTVNLSAADQDVSSLQDALHALETAIVQEQARFKTEIAVHGKPSRFVRLWPLFILAAFGGLRLLGSWRAVVDWCRNQILDTVLAFWHNWIVQPIAGIYGTIRHDEHSQIALMSGKSLSSDMESLERMVVTYVKDNSSATDETQILNQVKQGDISPILKSYEKQIQSPISNLIKGDLLRAILIQVQKTKVDVEVAASGIDKLMKSQELVFGLIAALPALVVGWWTGSYLSSQIRGKDRVDKNKSRVRESMALSVGNIESILRAEPSDTLLNAQGLGLVLCETHLLQSLAKGVMSKQRYKQWTADLQAIELAETVREQTQLVNILWLKYARFL